jgi:hypothetical protein
MNPIDLTRVTVFPLARRKSLARLSETLVNPDSPGPECGASVRAELDACARQIRAARERNASVMFIYGAHLIKNGGASLLIRLMEKGWLTHLATNGAGTIHDWEFSFAGVSTESVEKNVATGTFGTWDETGRNIHLALMVGALEGEGYGWSLGRFVEEDGVTLPSVEALEAALRREPAHPLAAARADLLQTLLRFGLKPGRYEVRHPNKSSSVLAAAYRLKVRMTVHPGIGYDIITTHPMFNGAVLGRAGGIDFRWFANAVEGLDGGVVMSVGSAIMGPQVFEKSMSCVNNLRLNSGRGVVRDHNIYVVDLQDGGNWDWTQGEPPKTNPAYYLRFCKSYSRMGGAMHYTQCDNVAFVQGLLARLK